LDFEFGFTQMPNIGTLSATITANASAFEGTIDKAARKAQVFGQTVGRALSAPANIAAKALSAPQRAVEGFLKPIGQALTSIPVVGGALAAIPLTGAGFLSWVKEGVSEIYSLGQEAQRLGVSVESLSAIQALAGDHAEEWAKGLFKLERQLGAVRAGNTQAAEGFAKLGLDAKALAEAPTEQALAMIADRIAALPTAADRAAVAFGAFGKAGAAMVGKLGHGGAGLQDLLEGMKKTGVVVSADDVARASEAQKALKETGRIIEGIKRQLAVASAPFLRDAAKWFNELATSGGGVSGKVREVVNAILEGLATAADALQAFLDKIEKRLEKMGNSIGGKIFGLGKEPAPFAVAGDAAGRAKQLEELEKQRKSGFAAMDLRKANEAMANIKAVQAANRAAEGGGAEPTAAEVAAKEKAAGGDGEFGGKKTLGDYFRDKKLPIGVATPPPKANPIPEGPSQEQIHAAAELTEKLQLQVEAYGLGGHAAELFHAKQQNIPEDLLKEARATASQLDLLDRVTQGHVQASGVFDVYGARLQRVKELTDQGKLSTDAFAAAKRKLDEELGKSIDMKAAEAFAETRTPLETFQARIRELEGLVRRGAISWEVYGRAAAKALSAMGESQGVKLPGGAQFGSREAVAAEVRFAAQGRMPQGPEEKVKQLLEQARQQDTQKIKLLQDMLGAIRGQVVGVLDF
jgi:hypothetical protein